MLPVLSYIQHYKKYYAAQFEAASAAYGLNQLEIDILLFLHNNPECHTRRGHLPLPRAGEINGRRRWSGCARAAC